MTIAVDLGRKATKQQQQQQQQSLRPGVRTLSIAIQSLRLGVRSQIIFECNKCLRVLLIANLQDLGIIEALLIAIQSLRLGCH